jgi:hypothetical protein
MMSRDELRIRIGAAAKLPGDFFLIDEVLPADRSGYFSISSGGG